MTAKKPKVGLRDEPQPDPKALALLDRIEAMGWREESFEEYVARLAAWRGRLEAWKRKHGGQDPKGADLAALGPEPDVDDLAPDKGVSDFDGLSIDNYAALANEILPGRMHGFAPSTPPDRPTPPRHDRAPTGADDRPPLTEEFVRCLRRRVKHGMALHSRDEFQLRPPDNLLE